MLDDRSIWIRIRIRTSDLYIRIRIQKAQKIRILTRNTGSKSLPVRGNDSLLSRQVRNGGTVLYQVPTQAWKLRMAIKCELDAFNHEKSLFLIVQVQIPDAIILPRRFKSLTDFGIGVLFPDTVFL